ncbi:MAG: putative peptidoglycan-binding protein [Myxococcaceae bacterium]|nr:putative peptidoglycan-binding protein [Myxococcaceae bacterium]
MPTTALLRHRVLPSDLEKSRGDFRRISSAIKGAQTLALGDQGAAVEALQRELRGIGAYRGPVSGTFDAATEEAVRRLQTEKHLAVSGAIDGTELAALKQQQLYVKSGFETPARLGQKGRDILAVERKLAHLGFATGKVDGVFDGDTLRALHKYRKADKYVPDTGDAIGGRVLRGLQQQVKKVESELKLLGGAPGRIDALFTQATEKAVRGFQRKHHLGITGVADAKTRAALAKASVGAGRFPDVKPGQFQKGYDTSHYQSQATFNRVLNEKSTRFMGIKATEGTGYTDPTFKHRWAQMGRKLEPGKFDLRLAYHFLTPGNGRAQADHFLKTLGIHGPLKPGTRLALDWEASALSSPQTLRDAAVRVHQVTGTWPLIYTSASRVAQAHRVVPKSPMWDAHWSPNSSDYKYPFVQTSGTTIDKDVFTGSEMALRKWAGWF